MNDRGGPGAAELSPPTPSPNSRGPNVELEFICTVHVDRFASFHQSPPHLSVTLTPGQEGTKEAPGQKGGGAGGKPVGNQAQSDHLSEVLRNILTRAFAWRRFQPCVVPLPQTPCPRDPSLYKPSTNGSDQPRLPSILLFHTLK